MYKNRIGKPTVVLAAACVAQFIVALDMSVVTVALPTIGLDLGFAPLDLSWVVHVYALVFGGLLLLGGRACDLYGRRRVFVAGLIVFGVCSLAGGAAHAPWQLIAARAGQGLGAAAVAPSALAMLTATFPEGGARVRALGVWSAVNAAGGALGVLAGGLLTEYAGWRWVMLVNIPIVMTALALIPLGVPAGESSARGQRLDWPGALAATAVAVLLVLGVVRADTVGWGSAITIATLATAGLLLAGLIVIEAKSAAPLLRPGLLADRWVSGANIIVFLAAAGQFAAFYLVSLYMQNILGLSAGTTGVAFLPFTAGLIAGTVVAVRITAAHSPRTALVPGAVVAAAGLCWFATIDPGGSFMVDVLGPSILTSVGVGLVLAPVATAATTGVAPHEAGMASGLMNSSRQLGGAVGVAALATIAAHRSGTSVDPVAVSGGYALGLAVAAGLFALAAVAAIVLLPRRTPWRTRTVTPLVEAAARDRSDANEKGDTNDKRLEGTPS
ncbi:MFS transporter [Gordonia sp. QH-12]|uniref:MFS transporter n=1 Tax=Gordonia sp. QH-12 TaxID=1437876 RepID=UPI0007828C74|nr:MFS transporter [Gordonia sp. QH-12]KXT55823.1 MFS transporter [Gordonia sp. QH-12]